MRRLKTAGLGFRASAAVVMALLAGLLATSQVSAQDETISITSATAAPGAEASVNLQALNIPAPGLGAWTVDVTYDVTVVTAVDCSPQQGSVCNTAYASGTVRVTGANANGVQGDNTLAGITFQCNTEGSTSLTPSVDVLADATIGDPQPIDAATESGSITCTTPAPTSTSPPPVPTSTSPPPAPTATSPLPPAPTATSPLPPAPTATATTGAGGLPGAGAGPGWDGGGTQDWLIAGLAGAGIAWLIAALAGAGLATVGGSGRPPLRPTEEPGRASATPTSRADGLAEPGAGGAGSESGSARNWLVTAREELAGVSLPTVPNYSALRRRAHRLRQRARRS